MSLKLESYLDILYKRYHHRCFVHPDPLEFLYNYNDAGDREIVGLIASSLAYGRVNQILKSVSAILTPMGPSPRLFIEGTSAADFKSVYRNFKHRFTTGEEVADLLSGIKKIFKDNGTLQSCYADGYNKNRADIIAGLSFFVGDIKKACGYGKNDNMTMLPDPEKGSSCKRLNLYLRWMVRSDAVDPGGWDNVSSSILLIPLDTHMYQFAKKHGLTGRNAADLKTAIEITDGMRRFSPDDPVKYDFSITRIGIRGNNCPDEKQAE